MTKLPILAALVAIALLAGCREEKTAGPMEPGIYQAIQPDGTTTRVVFKKDGSYADMEDNKPKPVDEGNWSRADGKLCLLSLTQGGDAVCFEEKPLGEDGSFTLTFNDRTTELRLIAK